MHEGTKIWDWRIDEDTNELLHLQGNTMDVYSPSLLRSDRGRNRWIRTRRDQPCIVKGQMCSVRETGPATVSIACVSTAPAPKIPPTTILEVLREWGDIWLWDTLRLIGDDDWLQQSIREGTCLAVTDGSYIKEINPLLCSAAFVLECSRGRGRIVGHFPEASPWACAFRGEMLGLMALHLILVAANKATPNLQGEVTICSDCLGALGNVADLPSTRIPARCKHSDILKTIMINCKDLTFQRRYAHVKAHQDDIDEYDNLDRRSQLNCLMDGTAKRDIWDLAGEELPPQQMFPLEPVAIYLDGHKLTSDCGAPVRYWVQKQIAEEVFYKRRILTPQQFHRLAWRQVYDALHQAPRMFGIWASKQVTDTAGTNKNLAIRKGKDKGTQDQRCPSCGQAIETTGHVLHCREAGRVDALLKSIQLVNVWMKKVGTDPRLRQCLIRFARGRGVTYMEDIAGPLGDRYMQLGRSQDEIGWRRFMEGMIATEVVEIQRDYITLSGSKWNINDWSKALVIKLLECTHGQWLYRNVHVHDAVSGTLANQKKERLRQRIIEYLDTAEDEMAEDDKYLLDIDVGKLDETSGETQEIWLMALETAVEASCLRKRRMDDAEVEQTRTRRV